MIGSQVEHKRRAIRSFVRRQGRGTQAQRQALAHYWPCFGVDVADGAINFEKLFGRSAPCFLEIGFGNGEALLAMAARHPDNNYLGIEVHQPGMGRLLGQLQQQDLNNVRVCCADVVEVLNHHIADASLAGAFIFFPDPWPKRRHHKRRLIQLSFMQLIAEKLSVGGVVHLATDWQDYAQQMLVVISACSAFENQSSDSGYVPRPAYRPLTKFERRGQRLGHGVWDLVFRRV